MTASDRLQEVPDAAAEPRSSPRCRTTPTPATRLLDGLGAGSVASVDTLDGVRMTLASGDIVHVRMSGNAPELRCYCEAATPARAEALMAAALARLATRLR